VIRGYLFIFIFFPLFGFSQEVVVIDNEKNPIPNVSAFNQTKTKSVLSDNDGVINLSRFLASDTILFQHPNYELKEIKKSSIKKSVELNIKYGLLESIVIIDQKNINNINNVAEKKIYITKSEISELNSTTPAEILEKSGGVSVQRSQLGGGSPNIRGFEANKVLLVLDGVRLNNAIYRSGHLQNIITIDEFILEDIEIVFGPSSVLFGSDALGGTVNMKTLEPYFRPEPTWGGRVSSSYHSAYSGFKDNVYLSFESSKYSSISSFSFKRFGDLKMGEWRPHGYTDWGLVNHYVDPTNGVVCNSNPNIQRGVGYSQYDFFNKMIFKINDHSRITSNIQYSTSTNIPRFDKLNDGDRACSINEDGVCDMTSDLEHSLKFHSYYYGPQDRFFSSLKFSVFDGENYANLFDVGDFILAYQQIKESRHKWYLSDFEDWINGDDDPNDPIHQNERVDVFSLNTNFRKGSWHFGSETIYNYVSSSSSLGEEETALGDTRYPSGGSDLFSSAYYVNRLVPISHKIQLEGGLRFTFSHIKGFFADSIDRDVLGIEDQVFSETWPVLSGNLKFVYYPNDRWKLSAVTARGFHSPNVDDLLKVFPKGNNLTRPNPELMPEYSFSQEISATKNISNNISIYGVGFFTQLNNAIIKDSLPVNINPDPNDDPFYAYQVLYNEEYLWYFGNQNYSNKINIYGFSLGFNAMISNTQIKADFNITRASSPQEKTLTIAHIPPTFGRIEVLKKINRLKFRMLCVYSGSKPAEQFDVAGVDNLDETPFLGEDPDTGEGVWAGLPSWYTINLSAQYKLFENTEISFGVENMLDAHYKTFGSGISAPGRNLICSLNYKF